MRKIRSEYSKKEPMGLVGPILLLFGVIVVPLSKRDE